MDESTTTEAPSTEVTTVESSTPPRAASEQPKASRSERATAVMNQFLSNGKGSRAGAASQSRDPDASQSPSEDAPNEEATTATTLTLTEEELNRRIQAETDRREARRNREAAQRTKEHADAERLRLLRDEPIQGAEQEYQRLIAEQEGQKLQRTTETVMEQYDRLLLDPIFQALPAKVQKDILDQNAPLVGLASRMANAKAGLAALEKHWKAEGARDAEKSLRANVAFRKELLAELRDEGSDPEIVGAARPAYATNMNDYILSRGRGAMPSRRVG